MSELLIDVIIPVYNCEAFISEGILSIQAQTLKGINIIVVDDGSEDNSAAIVDGFINNGSQIKLIRQPHLGLPPTLNAGLAASTAPYIAFLDADDLWHPQKMEKQLNCLLETHVEMCFCLLQEFQQDGPNQINSHRARSMPMKGYSKVSFLGQRGVFDKYGLFDEALPTGDFIEWLSRATRAQASVVMIDEVLAYRRVHNANTTRTVNKNLYLQILKTHLDEVRKINEA